MWLKEQYHLLMVAVSFLTRIPVKLWRDYLPTDSQQAVKYYPLVGLLLGFLTAGAFYLSQLILSTELAIVIAIMCSLLLTGALHEDGLADCVDAFGSSHERSRILEVMKDSHLGTYAVLVLICIIFYKFYSLSALAGLGLKQIFFTLILAYGLSRFVAISMMCRLAYVRIQDSKVSAEVHRLNYRECFYAALPLLPVFLFVPIKLLLSLLVVLLVVRYCLIKYFRYKLGGYTGDCLGATQQIVELFIYTVFVGYFNV